MSPSFMPNFNRSYFRYLIFLVVFILVHNVFNSLYGPWILETFKEELTRRQFEQEAGQISVLVLGDSHAVKGIATEFINNSFVLAFSGENYIQTYYKTKYYLEADKMDVDLVLLPVDLHSFSSFRSDRFHDPVFWIRYIDYFELGVFKGDLPKYLQMWLVGEFSYLGGLEEAIEKAISSSEGDEEEDIVNDFSPSLTALPQTLDDNPQKSLSLRVSRQFNDSEYLDDDLILYFYKLLDLFEAYDIPVVFVWYPVKREYYLEASKYVPVDQHLEEMTALIDKMEQNYTILDYHDVFWGRHYLFDGFDHLNLGGARLLSQQINRDLLELSILP